MWFQFGSQRTHQNININFFNFDLTVYLLVLVLQTVPGQGATTQCYPELGCFHNSYPWTSLGRPLPPPQDPQTVGTKLYCYTRASPQRYIVNLWPGIAINGCPMSATKQFVFITHGFAQSGNDSWMAMMKKNYLLEVDATVFLVDWGPGAWTTNYFQAASNTRIVGAEVARFLRFIGMEYGLTPDQVHLIGFSLGAHIFSYASNQFSKVAWITGLDPAQPAFEGEDKKVRLDKGDANFVDIIHTSAKPLIPTLGYGYIEPNGHVDIYVNGGTNQPGCPLPSSPIHIKSLIDLKNISVQVLLDVVFCSHARSFMFYTYAIHKCKILARETTFSFSRHVAGALLPRLRLLTVGSDENCTPQTCTFVGLKTRTNPARGVFGANTTSSPPFCGSPGHISIVL